MKKFINKPENYVDEMIDGIVAAHPDQVRYVEGDRRCIVTANKKADKVGLATGGGSGHLPLFLGYVGDGMLDGCSVGGVFQSPSSDQMLNVTKYIDSGKGVLYIYGNYGGDVMNFDMAAEMADLEGIRVESYAAGEDVASAPKGQEAKRRGVAGIFYLYKIAGAKAAEGASLDEVKRVTEKAGANVRTMGVALSPCWVPEVGKPSFELADDEMEIGMGIHGEPGVRRGKLQTANEIVEEMMDKIMPDLPFGSGDEVSVLLNGLGATPLDELYIAYRRVHEILAQQKISVFHVYAGEYATSMEMSGFSVSLIKLDAELKSLLGKSARTPFFEQAQL